MAKKILWSGSTVLPAPVEITSNDEIIWSSHTGRAASGNMIGDVVAQKSSMENYIRKKEYINKMGST